jgi:histone deacetylase 1/2
MSDPLGGRNKPVVSYWYDDEIGNYQYNFGHPMKPFRIRMTDEMIKAYGMNTMMKNMSIEREFIENLDLTVFHSDDYVDVLKTLTPENKDLFAD